MRFLLLPLLVLISIGCTRYEYDVISPRTGPELLTAGTEDDVVLDLAPLRYRLRTVENRLVVRIFNPTAERLVLVGAKSSVIDPEGQARPVRTQALPPGAHLKLILPPVRPQYVASGGGSGVGVRGGGAYAGPGMGRGEFGLGYDEPTVYTLRDGGEVYWDWRGETQAKLSLVFAREGGEEFGQEVVLGKRKAK